MPYQTLLVEVRDKVAKVIFNRPEKKNAMSPQFHKDMTCALEELRYNDEAAVAVVTGAGEAFCAGTDLKEFFHELKGKPAGGMGFVNQSVPRARLEAETMALAKELAGKDPVALRASKDAYRYSLEMPWDAATGYAVAKEDEVFVLRKGAWIEQGVGDFVKGLYKPGLERHGGVIE